VREPLNVEVMKIGSEDALGSPDPLDLVPETSGVRHSERKGRYGSRIRGNLTIDLVPETSEV
jgi:hypothetical protein